MKKESIIVGLIGILIGVVITSFAAGQAVNNNNTGMMRMMGIHSNTNNQDMMDKEVMSMGEMITMLKSKTGDDFDKAFTEQMIIHHHGAIDMAKLAQANAKHDEIKNLANDILSAQSNEIDEMLAWQTDWGYKTTPSIESHEMMH